ncbi:MAG: flagellar M-ring protein FliF C-terminal domain-containing protein, partial [Planctomycetota bacterium]
LVGGMLVYWGGGADMVPVDGLTTGTTAEAVTILEADGISARIVGGELKVAKDDLHQAVASLSRGGQLNPNASAAFDKLVNETSWMDSSTDKNRKYLLAKGHFLSAVIGSFPNVETASVILDKPMSNGFGQTHVDPSASVMVTMQPGSKVSKPMADTMIHMVASAVAGLQDRDVTVSDTINSRSFTAADEDLAGSLAHHESTLANERLHKLKIEQVLRSWEGVMVAVKIVTSDVVREQVQETEYGKETIASSETTEKTQRNVSNAGEAGIRPNVGRTIDGGGSTGTELSETSTIENFNNPLPTKLSNISKAGSIIRKINVSVVVPRSYYVRIFKAQNPDAEAPSDDELKDIIASEQQKITDVIEDLTVSSDEAMQPGAINVAMAYDQAYLEPVAAGVNGGLGSVVSSDIAHTGILAGLAVMAVGLMLFMVRKATRKEELPTIEELAGVPPTLPTDDELMGEVEEMDSTLAGVELDEDELRARQIADQISDLVRANPEEAGGLLTKWVVDDRNG